MAERRIALAEKRDQRETQSETPPAAPKPSCDPIELTRFVRTKLGKSTDDLPPAPESEPSNADGYDEEVLGWIKRLLGPETQLATKSKHELHS